MIRYTPVTNGELNIDDSNIFGYIGTDMSHDEICGKCIAQLNDYSMKILSLESIDDAETIEGFIRSTLNYGANRSAYIAYYCADTGTEIAKSLGFSEDKNGVLCGELPVLLAGSCCKGK